MKNREMIKGSEESWDKVSLKVFVSILVLTVVLSLAVSYIIVNLSSNNAVSKDTGKIMVDVVNSGDEIFSMNGQIKVEVVSPEESS